MSKFKVGRLTVGDRVKCIGKCEKPFGKFGSIIKDDGSSVPYIVAFDDWRDGHGVGDNEWWLSADQVEPAIAARSDTYASCAAAEVDNLADEYGSPRKFKAGDRVRYITAQPNYGAEPYSGELIIKEIGGGDWGDDVDLIYADYPRGHYTQIARLVDIEHVAPATTLRIEDGKFYKTRDGRKVGPMFLQKDSFVWLDTDPKSGHGWYDCGYVYKGGDKSDSDLIAEWTDEPAIISFGADRVPGYRFTKSNPPKSGDRVALRYQGTFTVEKVVGDQVQFTDRLHTWMLWDDENSSGCTLIEAAHIVSSIADIVARHSQSGTAIVAVLENGQPRPATRPYVHTTASAAETEANRLARTNPGKEFGVYTLGAVAKVEKTYEHEWQRLAAGGDTKEAARKLKDAAGIPLQSAKSAVGYWLAVAA